MGVVESRIACDGRSKPKDEVSSFIVQVRPLHAVLLAQFPMSISISHRNQHQLSVKPKNSFFDVVKYLQPELFRRYR